MESFLIRINLQYPAGFLYAIVNEENESTAKEALQKRVEEVLPNAVFGTSDCEQLEMTDQGVCGFGYYIDKTTIDTSEIIGEKERLRPNEF